MLGVHVEHSLERMNSEYRGLDGEQMIRSLRAKNIRTKT